MESGQNLETASSLRRRDPVISSLVRGIISKCASLGINREFVQILFLLKQGKTYDIYEAASLAQCKYGEAYKVLDALAMKGFVVKEKRRLTYEDYAIPKKGRPKFVFRVIGDDRLRKQILLDELEKARRRYKEELERIIKSTNEKLQTIDEAVDDVHKVFSEVG